ncbi:MAG: helix-turn-helix transcriptional regulator [Parvularculaceae bacterium]|nr:helix-turn-helix transcriptional regulator [Parvularculaceae bacterium]
MSEDQFTSLTMTWRTALMLAACLHLTVCAVLIWRRRAGGLAAKLLAALLLTIVGTLTPQMIGFAGFYNVYPWLTFAPFDNELLLGPLIWAYIMVLTSGRLPKPGWWVFAPAAIAFVYGMVWFLTPYEPRMAYRHAFHAPYIDPAETFLGIVFAVAGITLALRQAARYSSWLAKESAGRETYLIRYLMGAIASLAVPVVAWVVMDIIEATMGPLSYTKEYPFYLLLAASGYALGLIGLLQPHEPFPVMGAPKPTPEPEAPPTFDAHPDWEAVVADLRDEIVAKGWFKEPRLTVAELSKLTGLGRDDLSQAINRGAGANFSTFINDIRVGQVKERLEQGADDILREAFEAGFGSKATFNRVFKAATGETPSMYRQRMAAETDPD